MKWTVNARADHARPTPDAYLLDAESAAKMVLHQVVVFFSEVIRKSSNRPYDAPVCQSSDSLSESNPREVGGTEGGVKPLCMSFLFTNNHLNRAGGGPRRIRTPDPLIRSQVLYPAELSVRQERHLSPRARLCKRGSPGQSQSSHISIAGPPWAGRSQTACRPLRSRPGSACHHARERDRRKSTGPARCRPCARRPERA